MTTTSESALATLRRSADVVVALAGNPNVGKSSLFNQLTGLGVVTANYPGKTVELNLGTVRIDGIRVGIVDLPGIYALGAVSEDQWVARHALLDLQLDATIVVVDAANLPRNLYLVLQLLDLDLPVIVALNLVDEAERQGIVTSAERLSMLLDVPVVPTVATRGDGLKELLRQAMSLAGRGQSRVAPRPRYGRDVEKLIAVLARHIERSWEADAPCALSSRALAIALLEEDGELIEAVKERAWAADVIPEAQHASQRLAELHGEPGPVRMARERHGLAGAIADQAQSVAKRTASPLAILWQLTVTPSTGIPILVIVLGALFGTLFSVGKYLSLGFDLLWSSYISPNLATLAHLAFGQSVLARTLLWGFDAGIAAALGVGIPYVLTFYFLLALLEDTGYLNSITFLLDRVMHRLGLHGRAIIPLVAGAGCNVPAILATRVLPTMRERVIANALVVLIPCSARTAVILGAVAFYAGWQAAVAEYLIVFALVAIVGIALNALLPGEPSSLVTEMFSFRRPRLGGTALKTWHRFREFLVLGAPVVFVGSIALGALYETGYVWQLTAPLSPVVEGWLGLPAVAGLTLIFAVLRKELALQLLVALAVVRFGPEASNLLRFMSRQQIFVYAVVNTLYVPCVATITVLARELKWERATVVIAFTVGLALLVGGITWRVLQFTGWLA